MIEYASRHPEKILRPFLQHIELTLITLVISVLLASLFTLASMRSERAGKILDRIFAVIYSIPSLALFAVLIPVTGLGRVSAVIVLTLYNQYILLRNFTTGLREADPAAVEALNTRLAEARVTSDDIVLVVGGLETLSVASFACAGWCGGGGRRSPDSN